MNKWTHWFLVKTCLVLTQNCLGLKGWGKLEPFHVKAVVGQRLCWRITAYWEWPLVLLDHISDFCYLFLSSFSCISKLSCLRTKPYFNLNNQIFSAIVAKKSITTCTLHFCSCSIGGTVIFLSGCDGGNTSACGMVVSVCAGGGSSQLLTMGYLYSVNFGFL